MKPSKLKILVFILAQPLCACLPKANPMVETERPILQDQNKIEDLNISPLKDEACFITATPQPSATGQSVTLIVRTSSEVQALQLNGQSLKIPDDQLTVNPTDTTEYTAVGLGKDNNVVRCSVTVQKTSSGATVNPTPSSVPVVTLPDCVIVADPSKIIAGQAATLKISAPSNATSIILDNTAVANFGQKFVSPTFTQTFTGSYSTPNGSKSCSATIVVEAKPAQTNNPNPGYTPPANQFYYRNCTVTASRNQVMSCPVRCNTGNLLVGAQAKPEANAVKYGGRCDWSRLEDGSNGIWCHGENRSQFSGSASVCTCSISCENFNLNGN